MKRLKKNKQNFLFLIPGTAKTLYISLYVIVFLVSVLGNSLVVITIGSNKRMRNLTNIFLLSMAVSDLLIALVCLPINLTGRILTRFIFGPFMCHMFPYVIGKENLVLYVQYFFLHLDSPNKRQRRDISVFKSSCHLLASVCHL